MTTNGGEAGEDFRPLSEVSQRGDGELVSIGDMMSSQLAERDLKQAIQKAENRVEFVKQIKTLSLKITNAADWRDFGGRPYLQATGVEKLCALWGVEWHDLHMEPSLSEAMRLFRDNEPVSFEVVGIAGSKKLGIELVIMGGRSSNDEFFTTRYSKGQRTTRPLSEVDVMDVRKAALSNWEVQAVTRLLGLRGMSWEELAHYGIKPGGKVEFKTPQRPVPPPAIDTMRRTEAPSPDNEPAPAPEDEPVGLTIADMRQAIKDRLQREERNPDAALKGLTKGHVESLEGLSHAPDKYVRSIFDRIFPANA